MSAAARAGARGTVAAADAPRLVGEHASMRALRRELALVGRRDVPVLIFGESGVGKEVVARELHRLGSRAAGPFVAVNCCALPDGLLESELFGHERGAFTGAIARRPGRFERARGGTLFLDEVGDAPLATQAKLLRVLQERTFERLGGGEAIRADVRLVAATNRDLAALRALDRFRDDLFHRLAGFPLRVPPLRERASDVPLLVAELSRRRGLALAFSAAAMDRLRAHDWPGNVRELENCLERLAVYCDGAACVSLGDVELALGAGGADAPRARERFAREEADRLADLLERLRWNVSAAARELGISRGALRHRLRRHGLG
jgi:transcriptional regulator with GAF, ATPase, and Fis domain